MGSLASRPKAPSTQVAYVPQTTTTTASTDTSTTDTSADSAQTTAAEVRKTNLLSSARSRLGTVQTSFRGLLDLATGNTTRKTLLGE